MGEKSKYDENLPEVVQVIVEGDVYQVDEKLEDQALFLRDMPESPQDGHSFFFTNCSSLDYALLSRPLPRVYKLRASIATAYLQEIIFISI